VELLIATNPDPDSKLPYLLRLPLAGGMVFRTSSTWPRVNALYCYPVPAQEWPNEPDIVERVALRSCVRRGAAIDLVLDRGRENRSQIVFTKARGRDAVFWQSPRTRKQARPNVTTPTARAAGIAELEIVVDSREQRAYHFTGQQVRTVKRALACGDGERNFSGEAGPRCVLLGYPNKTSGELHRQCRRRGVWCSGEVGVPAVKVFGELVVEDSGADLNE